MLVAGMYLSTSMATKSSSDMSATVSSSRFAGLVSGLNDAMNAAGFTAVSAVELPISLSLLP